MHPVLLAGLARERQRDLGCRARPALPAEPADHVGGSDRAPGWVGWLLRAGHGRAERPAPVNTC
jgi:hypothetical protein